MKQDNNTMILYVVLGLIVLFALYCVFGKDKSESYDSLDKKPKSQSSEVEFIDQGDGGKHYDNNPPDAFELIGVAADEPAHQIGFGMGPGLYGSGRAESSMVGN